MSDIQNYRTFTITQRNGTQHIVTVDADRYDEVMRIKWHVAIDTSSKSLNPYVNGTLNGKHIALHHLIAGKPPKGMVVDHISNDTLDNRAANLRICSAKDNANNRRTYRKPTEAQ